MMVKGLRDNFLALGLILILSGLTGCAIEQIAGVRDVAAGKPDNLVLPVAFEQTWQRTWRHSGLPAPYEAIGTLKVSDAGLEFVHSIGAFSIPAESIRNVSYMKDVHEFGKDWVVLEYRQGPLTKTVEFKAPPDAAKDADNRIYWALFEAREAGLRKSESP